jgi:hypothetical protein
MKNRFFFSLMLIASFLFAGFTASAQFDDLYYDPDEDEPYYQYDYETSGGELEDEYYYDDEAYDYDNFDFYDDYDYYYSSRIKRFHRGCSVFDYYDPFYTDMYYYDPFYYNRYYSPGVSIYVNFGSPWRSYRNWYRPNYYSHYYYSSWNNPWLYDPWYYGGYYDPWHYSGWGYNNYYYTNYYGGGYYGYNNYYNNYYNNNNYYYGNKNKYGKGSEYGSRYGGSTVSSKRGKVRDSGFIGVPNQDRGAMGSTKKVDDRSSGFTDPGKGTFRGDREVKPDFKRDAGISKDGNRDWKPFDNESKTNNSGTKRIQPEPNNDTKGSYRSDVFKNNRSSSDSGKSTRPSTSTSKKKDVWRPGKSRSTRDYNSTNGSSRKSTFDRSNSGKTSSSGYQSPKSSSSKSTKSYSTPSRKSSKSYSTPSRKSSKSYSTPSRSSRSSSGYSSSSRSSSSGSSGVSRSSSSNRSSGSSRSSSSRSSGRR